MRKIDARIAIVDDDKSILYAAKLWLKQFFSEIILIDEPKEILPTLNENEIEVVLLDMNFRKGYENGKEGMYWLKEILATNPNIAVILMTAYGEVSLAVEALKNGATDFILKPWNNEKLFASVKMAVEMVRKNKKIERLEKSQKNTISDYFLSTKSPRMQATMNALDKVAPTDANVLITGENGTGKYVMAEYIHKNSSRSEQPFVHIDLGSLSEGLFESELFGYAKGAFTDAKEHSMGKMEAAQGGTVFLDEIGNLPMHLQTKLLSVIQNRAVVRVGENKVRPLDIRFVFATNENLVQKIQEKAFREDLFYRINTVEIDIPPLRERLEDLEDLSHYFLEKFSKKYHRVGLKISDQQWRDMRNYPWRGNIRELAHSMERAVIMSDAGDLSLNLNTKESAMPTDDLNLEKMEKTLIQKAMQKSEGNISRAAAELGISRAALYRKLEKM
ncbi:sigma-54-dependent Fis family transcriptional regulator [Ornithobacterium rhinotracheale]|uniref:sigma-54-dependent transcriptional regulator n=1 Tax=Ornithobacterium rhinotracheale TaxID=28251 RepID=UPI00129C61ED|nr:sigma-54 dependent transcriptional regulator [Ornithobacterium rhinotracheale]MRJ08203.1 sigma-54-dependent Fis family transcriptional regulator [Ornithobacterium rhinotracheale]UOH77400.1 sigma-54 dependent transcriptional regulator [Ornithobacterium rhinotracheale]